MALTPSSVLRELGIEPVNSGAWANRWIGGGPLLESRNPATGEVIASVREADAGDYEFVVSNAAAAWAKWREVPAPVRGDLIRRVGDAFRAKKDALGALISMEMGKIFAEGKGEVQEVVDIADFAAGLSRQLYGNTMHSERPAHRMYEQWHPLGVVGIITAFNFPAAVWSWNAMLAAVCGDAMVWKPSRKTPLTAIACQKIANAVLGPEGHGAVMSMVIGSDAEVGRRLLEDRRIPLVSATGSTAMGRTVAETVSRRLGRTLLELGGNNAIVVMDDADLDMATRALLFGAVGTAGQRCTSTRRVYPHEKIAEDLIARLKKAYAQVRVGDPLAEGTLMGPLVDEDAATRMFEALETIAGQGGRILHGGKPLRDGFPKGSSFVEPTLVRSRLDMAILKEEVFAPVLHLVPIASLEEGIAANNDVPQGLSSAIFTRDLRAAERWLSATGSDCGIANVNLGTSGAEIGGAFGGEKDTGGGRESGSDSWKAYMRRQTNTINFGTSLPLAQGIQFGDS